MKTFCCALVVLYVSVVIAVRTKDDVEKEYAEIVKECLAKVKITNSTWESMKNSPDGPVSKDQGCMSACIAKKYKYLDSNNMVSISVLKSLLADVKDTVPDTTFTSILPAFEKCAAKQTATADECEAGRKFDECLSKLIPKVTLGSK